MNKINLRSYKVLIIGDIMLDRYLNGNVSRISPEAPVPVLEMVKMENKPGGAANVALNIKSLGSQAILLGLLGNDINGKELLNCLKKENILTDYILQDDSRPTTVKTRIMSGGQHLLRIDEEIISDISDESKEILKKNFLEILEKENLDAVILQDYNKGLFSDGLIRFFIEKAKERDIFVSVDPKFDNFFSYQNVDLFKPNLKEVSEALNRKIKPELDMLSLVTNQLNSKLNFKHIYITLGDKGIFFSDGNNRDIAPTVLRDIVDVSGAGDVVLSVSTLLFLAKMSPSDVAHISNIAGGLACVKMGVATVSLDSLLAELKNN